MTPGQKIFFDLSMFDMQWRNEGYSICQIMQNNDLPKCLFCLKEILLVFVFYLNA